MTFECLPDCGKCCGVVPMDPGLLEKFRERQHRAIREVKVLSSGEVLARTWDGFCTFLSEDKRCLVYEERPYLCRVYGTHRSRKLQCPFIKPSGNPRTEAATKQFLKAQSINPGEIRIRGVVQR
jgi:Fe-S-cluster containining protein